ncbi:hypothetical protein SUDANB95_00094 [Actinosynnema sp. ALI-1.44]
MSEVGGGSASGVSRRGFLTAAAVVGSTTALGLAVPPSAWGAAALPAVGASPRWGLAAEKAEVEFMRNEGGPLEVNFEGEFVFEVLAGADKDSRKLAIKSFMMRFRRLNPDPGQVDLVELTIPEPDEVTGTLVKRGATIDMTVTTKLYFHSHQAEGTVDDLLTPQPVKITGEFSNWPPKKGANLRVPLPLVFAPQDADDPADIAVKVRDLHMKITKA